MCFTHNSKNSNIAVRYKVLSRDSITQTTTDDYWTVTGMVFENGYTTKVIHVYTSSQYIFCTTQGFNSSSSNIVLYTHKTTTGNITFNISVLIALIPNSLLIS